MASICGRSAVSQRRRRGSECTYGVDEGERGFCSDAAVMQRHHEAGAVDHREDQSVSREEELHPVRRERHRSALPKPAGSLKGDAQLVDRLCRRQVQPPTRRDPILPIPSHRTRPHLAPLVRPALPRPRVQHGLQSVRDLGTQLFGRLNGRRGVDGDGRVRGRG